MNQIEVELQDWLGNDRAIAEAAWTSSTTKENKDLRTAEDIKRVVNMLADLKHSVPFESVVFRFWYRLPIAIDRQHMTHRIGSHSGMSGRYRTMPSEYYAAPNDIRNIVDKLPNQTALGYSRDLIDFYDKVCIESNRYYSNIMADLKTNKDNGTITAEEYKRCREFFRGMLPQHNMTERVSIFNLRSFSNYYKLRSKSDAQPEIQLIANKMLEQIKSKNICPIAMEALERNNWII